MTQNIFSEASVVNLALARMGSQQTIVTLLPSDTSAAADQARLWYPQDRDAILCDFPWPWAEFYAPLAQVAGPEIDGQVANAQWSRSYRYPSDCLKLRRLMSTPGTATGTIPQTTGTFYGVGYGNEPWKRPEGDAYPISFREGHDGEGRLIYTDSYGSGNGLTMIYTAAVEDPTQFSADFVNTLSWRLAADLAMGLGFSDGKREYAEKMYERTIRAARATHLNASQSDIPFLNRQAGVIRARWGG